MSEFAGAEPMVCEQCDDECPADDGQYFHIIGGRDDGDMQWLCALCSVSRTDLKEEQ